MVEALAGDMETRMGTLEGSLDSLEKSGREFERPMPGPCSMGGGRSDGLNVADSSGTNPFMGRGLLENPMAMFQREGPMAVGASVPVAPLGMTWNPDILRMGADSGGSHPVSQETPRPWWLHWQLGQ